MLQHQTGCGGEIQMLEYDSFSYAYKGLYTDCAPVIKAARSFTMLHDRTAKECVLCIHGYAGYPGELVSPAQALYKAGYDVYVPRLPGMGTSGNDFKNTTRFDWMIFITKIIERLKEDYNRINLLAHSMGCLIAVISSFDDYIGKLVLAMPAFSIPSLDKSALTDALKAGDDYPVHWHSDARYNLHYENAPCDDEILGREYYSHMYPSQLIEMEVLRANALSQFAFLEKPALVLASHSDAVVDYSWTELYPGIAEIRWIEGATHYVFYDIDPECEKQAVAASIEFFRW